MAGTKKTPISFPSTWAFKCIVFVMWITYGKKRTDILHRIIMSLYEFHKALPNAVPIVAARLEFLFFCTFGFRKFRFPTKAHAEYAIVNFLFQHMRELLNDTRKDLVENKMFRLHYVVGLEQMRTVCNLTGSRYVQPKYCDETDTELYQRIKADLEKFAGVTPSECLKNIKPKHVKESGYPYAPAQGVDNTYLSAFKDQFKNFLGNRVAQSFDLSADADECVVIPPVSSSPGPSHAPVSESNIPGPSTLPNTVDPEVNRKRDAEGTLIALGKQLGNQKTSLRSCFSSLLRIIQTVRPFYDLNRERVKASPSLQNNANIVESIQEVVSGLIKNLAECIERKKNNDLSTVKGSLDVLTGNCTRFLKAHKVALRRLSHLADLVGREPGNEIDVFAAFNDLFAPKISDVRETLATSINFIADASDALKTFVEELLKGKSVAPEMEDYEDLPGLLNFTEFCDILETFNTVYGQLKQAGRSGDQFETSQFVLQLFARLDELYGLDAE